MPDLTLKRMDAAIAKIVAKRGVCGHTEEQRAIYLAGKLDGMRDAAKINSKARNLPALTPFMRSVNMGHDEHKTAIRAAIRRLKREVKNAD